MTKNYDITLSEFEIEAIITAIDIELKMTEERTGKSWRQIYTDEDRETIESIKNKLMPFQP